MEQDNTKKNSGNDETESTGALSQDFSQLIFLERSLHWGTAKNFWSEKKEELGCSYNRYSVIENGTARASLDLALKIIRALGIKEDSGLFAWVRDMTTDEESRSYFADPNIETKISHFPVMYLDKAKTDLFRDEEFAFDLAGYITVHTYRGVSEDEICQVFKFDKVEARKILIKLLQRGVIIKNSVGLFEVPDGSWIQIPDHHEFRLMKTRFIHQAIESHFSTPYSDHKTLQVWYFRLLSQRQLQKARAKYNALVNWIGMLPDEPGGEPYNFCILGNQASFGKARKKLFHEDRDVLKS